jgi:alpha-L-fucosidase 2
MLLQSRWSGRPADPAEIRLLPALPAAWPEGQMRGLLARGGIEVSMEWKGGRLQKAELRSNRAQTCRVCYGKSERALSLQPGKPVELDTSAF